ncbi:polysaccharide deacetylase family protein [bacterium]|nr:polysaccharide deacetylase family protein [bacterium]
MLNALSVDLEDWYMGLGVPPHKWNLCEDRIVKSTGKILDLLRGFDVKATFFVLGWIAEQYPELILAIKKENHEIASHGYLHKCVFNQSAQEFEFDLKKSISCISKITGEKILGYRAPCWSIRKKSFWALDILKRYDIKYDSSIYPVKFPFFGLPGDKRYPYLINKNLMEFPPSVIKILGKNIPFAGGIFLRMFPYWVVHKGIKLINKKKQPALIHIHPRELDENFSPVKYLSFKWKVFQTIRIGKTEDKFRLLLKNFRFGPIKDVFSKFCEK